MDWLPSAWQHPLLFLYRNTGPDFVATGSLWRNGKLADNDPVAGQLRQQIGRPWTTAAIILGAVALLTLLAGLLMNTATA
jgi:hypothetical protein